MDGVVGYDMKSGTFSTWTESIWQSLTVRMFLKPSAATERFSMILGSVVAASSFLIVWSINKRASVLFNSRFVLIRIEKKEKYKLTHACNSINTHTHRETW